MRPSILLLGSSLSKVSLGFAPTSTSSFSLPRSVASTSTRRNLTAMSERKTLSVAVLGGGISGHSCASQLLSRHKRNYDPADPSSYELEVTLFDTGRLRPGGRCSSRLPGDEPPVVKNRSSGQYPVKKNDDRSSRRACDNDTNSNGGNGSDDENKATKVPENILRAMDGALSSDQSANSSRDRIVSSMGPVDHAAQILSIPSVDSSSFDEFRDQLKIWVEEGTVEPFPEGSVCELLPSEKEIETNQSSKLEPLEGDMYYGKGGMGTIPVAMRDHCLSFTGFGDNYTGQSFRILQDVWVSPSNGVKYIGNKDDENGNGINGDNDALQWELRAGKKSLGKYHRLVISHNGKCADRIMSKTPARAFHSLLRTRFAPYVPKWGGREMTLNSIYSLVFAVKSERDGDGGIDGNGGLGSPIARAVSKLSPSTDGKSDIYTVMIKNEPTLRLLSCNTLKHRHARNPNSDSNIEVYTLLSSPKFGKEFKGPQENLPPNLVEKVVVKMLSNLERSLYLESGSVVDSVVDLRLQLWGAAVPMNTWRSTSICNKQGSDEGADGFVYDAEHGVGACGDWMLDPSIAGAWESGRRLADWMLSGEGTSVGLPDRSSQDDKGAKFVPSRAALGSGIGTVPSSAPDSEYEFPSNDRPGSPRGGRGGRGPRGSDRRRNNPGRGRRNGSRSNKGRGNRRPQPAATS